MGVSGGAHLDHLGALDDLAAVEHGGAVQRVVGPARHDVRPLGVGQVPEPRHSPGQRSEVTALARTGGATECYRL